MKKLFITLALACATLPALAQHYGPVFRHHNHYRGHYHGHGGWVAPLIIGGTIGYVLNRPAPVVIEQPPVVVQQPPMVYQTNQNCTPWTETHSSDGTITRTRTCAQ